MRPVGKITEADRAAVRLIQKTGFVRVEGGLPHLESNTQIGPWRFHRLVVHGFLTPNNDALFGAETQTYQVTDHASLERS